MRTTNVFTVLLIDGTQTSDRGMKSDNRRLFNESQPCSARLEASDIARPAETLNRSCMLIGTNRATECLSIADKLLRARGDNQGR